MLHRLLSPRLILILPFLLAGLSAQVEDLKSSDAKTRLKAVKSVAQKGEKKITPPDIVCPALGALVSDPVNDIRSEVIVGLIKTGSEHCNAPLMAATRDATAELQSMAVDGLVNFYLPGYVKFGWLSSVKSFAGALKNRFRASEPLAVDPYVSVKPEIISTIARLITGGSSMESRANAARAVGILRGKEAIPELKQGLQSKNSMIIIESARALEKIRDPSVGPALVFLLRDLDEDVQIAVAQTIGQLRTREAIDSLQDLVKNGTKKVQREALIALAKIPDNGGAKLFLLYLRDNDEQLRAAAAEGVGRAGNKSDLQIIQDAFAREKNESARLSMAFSAAMLGDRDQLSYLIDGLDSTFHRLEARPFLTELARDPQILAELYTPLQSGTRDQKIHLAYVVSRSGTRESAPHLERLTKDPDPRVAEAAITALKTLQARL